MALQLHTIRKAIQVITVTGYECYFLLLWLFAIAAIILFGAMKPVDDSFNDILKW